MATEVRRVRRRRKRQRNSPPRKTRYFLYAIGIAVGLGLGIAFSTYAPRAYSGWRESRLLKRATQMLRKGDFDTAMRDAHQMLLIRPDSLAAYQILADSTEQQNLPDTVAWRAQIARLLPDNLEAQLNLASAALRFGQIDVAARALDKVSSEDREKAAYHVVAGWLARAQGNEPAVENHFAAAVKKEPANDLYQFNLAVLQVRSPDPEKNARARETLDRLSKVQGFRTGALRALLNDAIQRSDLERADHLAQDLQMTQQVTFADLLLCLEFYRKLDQKKFAALLEKVKPVAARDSSDLAALIDWLNKNGLAAEALKWTDKLPAVETSLAPPSVALAETFAELKNWSRLKRWTRSGSWGDSEFLRFAYQSFAARQARQASADAEADALWHSAEKAAAEYPEREAALARLATKWSLVSEAKALWVRVAKHPPLRREALDALYRSARSANELPELLQVSRQLHDSSPREPGLASNYARFALLLAPSTEEAQRLARETYEVNPGDPQVAVTYAFALYGMGRTAEGLKILQKLPNEELRDPHVAVYLALLLLDSNEPQAAQEYIEAARQGPLYLEEKKLLDEALAKSALPPAASPSPSPGATPP